VDVYVYVSCSYRSVASPSRHSSGTVTKFGTSTIVCKKPPPYRQTEGSKLEIEKQLLDAFFTVSPHHPHTKFASWWSISAPVWRDSQWMKKNVKRRGLVDCQSIYTVLGGCPQLASPVSTRCTHMIIDLRTVRVSRTFSPFPTRRIKTSRIQ
jgi:hypothetical protein